MYQAILFLPLIGAIFAGFFGRLVGGALGEVVTTTLVLITALLSWLAFYQVGHRGAGDADRADTLDRIPASSNPCGRSASTR